MERNAAAAISLKIIMIEGHDFSLPKNELSSLISDAEKCLEFLLSLVVDNDEEEECPSYEEFLEKLEEEENELSEQAALLGISCEEYKNYLIFMFVNS